MNHAQFGFQVRPDVLCDVSKLDVFASASMDFVYSSHTLEHIEDYQAALREWWRVVKPGGYLILYLPHRDFYPNIGQPGANPDHKHDFVPEDIILAMPNGYDLVERQARNGDMEYSMLLVFKKIGGRTNTYSHQHPRPDRTACVVRYGAYGDLMQSSSVWAGLKSLGYHVTVFSSPPGSDVISNDPNIDNLVLFDKDQVPNASLLDFWEWQKKKYDKWVNLSEFVEGTLLAMKSRTLMYVPPAVRHSFMDRNYVEHQHALAEIPYVPRMKFYPTRYEVQWARQQRDRLGAGPVFLWSLAGSSVHKTWPYLDNAMAWILLEFPDSRIVLTGGPECVILEQGWENESRVWRRSGQWAMRETLAFAPMCDCVVGPETGVMNAVAMEEVPKILFLSHSTVNNLSRDWKNTHSLFSSHSDCPGRLGNQAPACHQFHYGWEFCKRDDETSTAECQKNIPVEQFHEAVRRFFK